MITGHLTLDNVSYLTHILTMPYYTVKKMGQYVKIIEHKKGISDPERRAPRHSCATCKYAGDCLHQINYWEQYHEDNFNCPYYLSEKFSESAENAPEKQKLQNNLIRAKNTVKEIALCNNWDWFITLTLDSSKAVADRYDLELFQKKLSKWINHQPFKIKYILVPEMHKDGAWHMHGLISGIPDGEIEAFPKGFKKNLEGFYNWKAYEKKFGFCSLGKIKSPLRVAMYVSKYITKSIEECDRQGVPMSKHLYYASLGLNRAEVLLKNTEAVADESIKFYDANEFCNISFLPENELKIFIEEGGCKICTSQIMK